MEGNRRERLTDALVRRLPLASEGQYAVRDTELVGFMVMVGKTSRTFMIQMKIGKQNVKRVVARVGDVSLGEARVAAAKLIADLRSGTTRYIGRARAVTLGEAWADYRDNHLLKRGRSPSTVALYRDHVERLYAKWLDTPLADLAANPKMVRDRHGEITRQHGPYIANGAGRSLRAIYNFARRKIDRNLPSDPPIDASDFNAEERRNTAMAAGELPAWRAQLDALPNPVRREFHLFCLLSGSRPAALCRARWAHLSVSARTLRFPDPKGGKAKAFDMPLSREMLRCLWRARRAGKALHQARAAEFIFPAVLGASGHIEEWREDRDDLSKWGADLRQTYATMAQAAGVPLFFIKVLMNHAAGGDVTLGYVTLAALRDQVAGYQQLISTNITRALGRGDAWAGKVEAAARHAGYTSLEGVTYDERTDKVGDAMRWEVEAESRAA